MSEEDKKLGLALKSYKWPDPTVNQVDSSQHLNRINNAIANAFGAGFNASNSQSLWVPIADINESYLSAESVDLWVRYSDESGSYRLPDCRFVNGYWRTADYELSEYDVYPTHAMLPIRLLD